MLAALAFVACRTTPGTTLDWRVVASSSWVVIGTLRAEGSDLDAAAAKGGDHVWVRVEIDEVLAGNPVATPAPAELIFRYFAAPAGSTRYPLDPSLEQMREHIGRRRMVFLRPSEGCLWLADGSTGRALLAASPENVRAVQGLLEKHRHWLAEPLPRGDPVSEARVQSLVDELVTTPERQRAALAQLESLGESAVPALVRALDDRRRLAEGRMSLENLSPQAFEGVRQYSPELVIDALAALLNQLTHEDFGFVFNGASEEERDLCAAGWKLYARHIAED